jgi:hypothetical protein
MLLRPCAAKIMLVDEVKLQILIVTQARVTQGVRTYKRLRPSF